MSDDKSDVVQAIGLYEAAEAEFQKQREEFNSAQASLDYARRVRDEAEKHLIATACDGRDRHERNLLLRGTLYQFTYELGFSVPRMRRITTEVVR